MIVRGPVSTCSRMSRTVASVVKPAKLALSAMQASVSWTALNRRRFVAPHVLTCKTMINIVASVVTLVRQVNSVAKVLVSVLQTTRTVMGNVWTLSLRRSIVALAKTRARQAPCATKANALFVLLPARALLVEQPVAPLLSVVAVPPKPVLISVSTTNTVGNVATPVPSVNSVVAVGV